MANATQTLDERQFALAMRRLADTLATGADASPFVGAGVDYAQSRAYAAGDSTRAIDWRVTARTGKTFVKEYEAHKRLAVHVIVDASASMRLGSAEQSKFDWAVLIAGALALSSQNRQNPVGLHTTAHGSAALQVRPTLSRDHAYQWLELMRQLPERSGQHRSIADVVARFDMTAPERGVLVVLSDLHEPDAIAAIKRVAQRHDVAVLRLFDAMERRPTGGGFFRAVEAETGRRFLGFGRRSPAAFADATSKLAAADVDCIELCVNDDFLPRLQSFLRDRKRSRGR